MKTLLVAVLAFMVGCGTADPSYEDSDLAQSQGGAEQVFAACVGHTADTVYALPEAAVRYSVLATIFHVDGSSEYQHPAFEPIGEGTRASVSCFGDGSYVMFERTVSQ